MNYLPLVSIQLPVYNASAYILDCLKSIYSQTYPRIEVCIVDDGSTDDTLSKIMDFKISDTDKRCSLSIYESTHVGCTLARNMAVKMCNGEIIARFDADDLQLNDRLEKQVEFLLTNRDIPIVSTRMLVMSGKMISEHPAACLEPDKYLLGDTTSPCCPSIVAWQSVYNKLSINGEAYDGEHAEDGDWNIRAIKAGYKFGCVNEFLYCYRRHPQQLSGAIKQKAHREHLRRHGYLK